MSLSFRPVLASLVFLAAAGAARAQQVLCFGGDNLGGACCAPTQANLPNFPPTMNPGLLPFWTNCQPGIPSVYQVALGALVPTACGAYQADLHVTDPATGNPVLDGIVTLDYTRTWGESNDADPAPELQVWRFAAKADLHGNPAFNGVPNCLGAFQTAFYYGYVDFAARCGHPGEFQSVVVLYHACDAFVHDPMLSDHPGVFHPNRSYALVSPSTAGNPFVVANLVPLGGVVADEGMREAALPGGLCRTEDPTAFGNLVPIAVGCACPFALGGGQQSANLFSGQGSCPDAGGQPGAWVAFNGFGLGLPWVRMITTSIGHWSNASSYPGPEQASVDEGLFLLHDACAAGGAGGNFGDLLYGATTAGGYPVVVPAGAQVPQGQVDLASNYALAGGAPPAPPFVGSVFATRHLVYVNVD